MTATLKPGTDQVAQSFFELKFAACGMSFEEVSAACGWTPHAFQSQRTAGFPCLPLRFKVEASLGWCPIWSSSDEVSIRKHCFTVYGIDPRTASLIALKNLCRRLGVHSPNVRRQREWQVNLVAWLSVNRKIEQIANKNTI
jgi:hypothetical protein